MVDKNIKKSIYELLKTGYFGLAKNVSKESVHRYQLGAVIVKKKPISIGFNKDKTHPAIRFTDFVGGIHAEFSAIINAGRSNLKGTSIFVYRELENGIPAIARPCDYCWERLRERGVKWVYYTTDTPPYWKKEKIT